MRGSSRSGWPPLDPRHMEQRHVLAKNLDAIICRIIALTMLAGSLVAVASDLRQTSAVPHNSAVSFRPP